MKIGLQTWGSDGDILPFIALANGLSSVGHEVTVAYTSVDNKDYSHMGKSMNINFIRAYDKFDSETENIFTDITKTKDALKEFILILEKYFDPAVEEMKWTPKQGQFRPELRCASFCFLTNISCCHSGNVLFPIYLRWCFPFE